MYTFGGGGPQYNARRARNAAGAAQEPQHPLFALLPVALLAFFVLFSLIPTLFSGEHHPDPEFRFKPSTHFDTARTTWQRSVPYHVNKAEFEKSQVWQSVPENYRDRMDAAMFSSKLRGFERGIEEVHIRQLQAEVRHKEQRRRESFEGGRAYADAAVHKLQHCQTAQDCRRGRAVWLGRRLRQDPQAALREASVVREAQVVGRHATGILSG